MEEVGFVNFTGMLDPGAEEFIPATHFPMPPPQIYYPYPFQSNGDVSAGPYCEPMVGYSYTQYHAQPAYVRVEPPRLPVALPPPSPSPSRALLLSSVPTEVSESTVRRDLEVYGDVRAVEMGRVREGIVAVHFYDLRHAQTALGEIQEQHMQQQCRLRKHFDAVLALHNSPYESAAAANFPPPQPPPVCGLISGRAVWAQFMIPVTGGYPEAFNQGTLVLFNVDCQVPTNYLKETFEAFGCVKELRETPLKRSQRFIEFYDTRDAAKAYAGMNGKEINGRHLIIEYSRPGGYSKKFSKSALNNNSNRLNFSSNYPLRSPRLVTPPSPLAEDPYLYQQCKLRSPPQLSVKNPRNPNGSRNTNVMGQCGRINSSFLNGSDGIELSNGVTKKNPKKSSAKYINNASSSTSNSISKQENSKLWKGPLRSSKEYDPQFLIKEDAIMLSNCSDSRTTVMIKNIPNKYSQKLLLNMLDNHCIHYNEQIAEGDNQPLSSYNFVYLPIDFVNKCNVGYGFVNMTSPEATLRLYKSFHLQNWEVFNSRKICQVTYARLQGVEALKEHFKTSKFPCEADEYMPVVFMPPRDGRTLTAPVPIVGRGVTSNNNNRSNSNSTVVNSNDKEEEYYSSNEEHSDEQRHNDINDDGSDGSSAGSQPPAAVMGD